MTPTPEWISMIAPFVSGAAGIGVAWGIIRQKVIETERRIGEVEKTIKIQVGEVRCNRMREGCKNGVAEIVGHLREEVVKNRESVADKFETIARFMGKHNGD